MSNAATTNENFIIINDCEKLIKETIQTVNKINIAFKDKNLVGKKREEANKTFEAAVEQLVDITSAGLLNNLIESDPYDILQAKVDPKVFKNCAGHVNSIIKRYLTEKQNIPLHEGAQISDVELAKLIQTPYRTTEAEATEVLKSIEEQKAEAIAKEGYDENLMKQVKSMPEVNEDSVIVVTSVSGEEAIIDKDEKAIYMKGNVDGKMVIWKKKLVSMASTWYETAKNIAISFFKLVWSYVSSVGSSLIGGAIGIGKVSVDIVANTGKGMFEGSKSFWKNLKSSRKDAIETTKEKGLYC